MRYLFKKIYVGVSPSLKSINNLPAYTGPIAYMGPVYAGKLFIDFNEGDTPT